MKMIEEKDIISLIDLTSLNTVDNSNSIHHFINKANLGFDGVHPASVCVYPKFAEQLRNTLNPKIKSCVVSTYFPSSQAPLKLKLQEIAYLESIGVDEIDIVLPIGDFLAGNYKSVSNELTAIRKQTNKTIKLIIETGLLKKQALIEKATKIGIDTGMEFIKTSTGKSGIGADLLSTETIARTIKKHSLKTGLKIAGGIKTKQNALQYMNTVSQILGMDYIDSNTFRIGASSLYDNLISKK